MSFFIKLNNILTSYDKKFLFYLFIFTVVIAAVETVGVSIIMPFLSVANDFTLIDTNKYYNYFYQLFAFQDHKSYVIIFGIAILIFYLLRTVLNSIYVYTIMYFINSRYDLIVNRLFKKYLSLPYKSFITHNTSSLTKVIINEAANVTELFWFLLILISELLVFIFIYVVLMYINYKVTIGISVLIVFVGFFIKLVISKRMKFYGEEREQYQKVFYELLNRNFQNIKMLKLHFDQSVYSNFAFSSKMFVKTKILSSTLQQLPRYIFELMGFSLVVLIVLYYLLSDHSNYNDLFSIVSVFILGLYRILPSITRIFLSYNTILYQYKSLDIIYQDLNLECEDLGTQELKFQNEIKLENISFAYGKCDVFKDISLSIKKNEKIAFVGESGSGKSTLVDIIMGLHMIDAGNIMIDHNKLTYFNLASWRKHFGYIPQNIYLFDGTVAQNVAFNLNIDEEKVVEALKQAKIWDFLVTKEGLDTMVGESGVMLSGGQKQRIAIARALYQNPDIIVLDEATSALDEETERQIMEEIYSIAEDKTLIIIAHKLSTIQKCEKIYMMKDGKLTNV